MAHKILTKNLDKQLDVSEVEKLFDVIASHYSIHGPVDLIIFLEVTHVFNNTKAFLESIKRRSYLYKMIDQCAVVTSSQWLMKTRRIINILKTGVELRIYNKLHIDEAIEWLESKSNKTKANVSIAYSRDNNLSAFNIYNTIGPSDVKFIDQVLKESLTYNWKLEQKCQFYFSNMDADKIIDSWAYIYEKSKVLPSSENISLIVQNEAIRMNLHANIEYQDNRIRIMDCTSLELAGNAT